ncbi:hypothetical protein [Bacillus sp. Marseille-Q1617]|uniref:hypothetical protein n=1 Tax=Bacillus sp. Marseille-Q1617 TaxID=2736887 RepID=UPI00158B514C|nr:hypothetical protein [Bacillus sp. Marseille-Q1617]
MRKGSIWSLLVFLAGLQQVHILEYQDVSVKEELKADTSHLRGIDMILSTASSLPHPVDDGVPLKAYLTEKIRSFAPAGLTGEPAMVISPDTIGFIEVVMYQSNYLS